MKPAKKAALLAELARLRAENARLALALLEKDWRASEAALSEVPLDRVPAADLDAFLRRMIGESPQVVAVCEAVAWSAQRVRFADAAARFSDALSRLCRPRP